jgi:AcrR family transcriptional regulator
MPTIDKPLRRDAERNRARILEAARELFAERGLAATMDDIAERAGLGVGTVYRRFSSRDALVEALFEEKMLAIVELADDALACEEPWEGLTTFLERLVSLQALDRGLKEVVLGSNEGRERVSRIRERMRPRGEEMIRRAQAAGALRSDFSAADLPILQMMLGAVADVSTPEHADLWRRFFALLIDGMRAGNERTPLPQALPFESLDEVMCNWRPMRWRPPEG